MSTARERRERIVAAAVAFAHVVADELDNLETGNAASGTRRRAAPLRVVPVSADDLERARTLAERNPHLLTKDKR